MEKHIVQITIIRRIKLYEVINYQERYVTKSEFSSKEAIYYLIITQEKLIHDIAEKEDIDVTTVRKIFKSAENRIIAYLSSITPSENVIIKLLNGLSLEGKYVPERELHTYDDIICKPRIWVKAKITRYWNKKVNKNN